MHSRILSLPIPGGPDSSAAFHGPLGPPRPLPLPPFAETLKVLSQPDSHLESLPTLSAFPSISELCDGAYLSAQRELIPSSLPDPGCSGALLLEFEAIEGEGGCCRCRASVDGGDDDGFLAYGLGIVAAAVDDEDEGLAYGLTTGT